MRTFIFLMIALSLTGCATVKYFYNGIQCDKRGYNLHTHEIVLVCPDPETK